MRAAQRREGKAELADRAGLEVLHEHVGLREHGGEQRLVVGAREVEHHRFLAAVEPDEIGAFSRNPPRELVVVAREISVRPLDLDHARTGIGEPAGAHRRRHRLLERHDHEA